MPLAGTLFFSFFLFPRLYFVQNLILDVPQPAEQGTRGLKAILRSHSFVFEGIVHFIEICREILQTPMNIKLPSFVASVPVLLSDYSGFDTTTQQ